MNSKASLNRLEFCNFKLRTLLEFTLAINQNLSTTELLKKYEKLLRWKLNIGKVLMFANNHGWDCVLVSGISDKQYQSIDVENDLLKNHEISMSSNYENSAIHEFDIVIPIVNNKRPLAFLLVGDIDEETDGVSPTIKHMQFIQTLTNIVIVAIENKRLFKDNLERERMSKEMELATEVQTMLVPDLSKFPGHPKIVVEGFYLPHYEVGGDYYDIFELSDDEIGFCIADVSGKGISAALLMSNFQANVRALFVSSINLSDVIKVLNQRIINSVNGEKFITLFIARFNTKTNKLIYVNAGHNPPILYNRKTKQTSFLKSGCIGLGMEDTITRINEGDITIENDSKLLCYTDGLIEMEYKDKISSKLKTVESCFCNNKPINESFRNMITKIKIKKSNPSIFDDITMLGLDFLIENNSISKIK
jgi:sigma-B regulation protein RsbU (phosphoserine phosphatase)